MDFRHERYVRLYVRDTVTWSLLSWQARAVFPQLIRKCDRAGVIDVPIGMSPAVVIARLIDFPDEIVGPALGDLVAAGVIVLNDDALVMPKFIDAQTTPSSTSQRQAECRARKRLDSKLANNRVTRGHTKSRVVTACHPELSRSEPIRAELNREGEGDLAAQVIEHMRAAVQRMTGERDAGPRHCKSNRDLILRTSKREGATLADWKFVIDRQASDLQHKPDKWLFLRLSTICTDKHWRNAFDSPRARPAHRGPIDPSTQDHAADEANPVF